MSEEEKEAILNLRLYSSNTEFSKYDGTTCLLRARDVQILLNLVGKQHQELEQEKEKNKELEIELAVRDNIKVDKLVEKYRYYRQLANSYQANCISKDKIKELLENEIIDISGFRCIAVEDIENLLEV